ncbi:hypothetical protein [Nonomuraea harbinensis]|uniref:CSLREA domain-containing protein n=1 Tax=Nonomuraea harbinensis TaxID=1286938 RepID=A0ABW1C4R2_9ACTN|nr:hypothetical protein [Nonomuraea harbinensis]
MSWQRFRAQGPARNVRRAFPARLLVAASLAAGVVTLPALPADAATVSVRCSVSDLVRAIRNANNSPGPDTLNLSHRCHYRLVRPDTANPATGLPAITSDITINGNGAAITRVKTAPAFRILLVAGTGTLTLNRITISGGRATDCPGAPAPPNPPGLVCGGGINNQGTLTVNHSRVIGNTATSGVFAEGGGIDSDGTATLYNTDVSYNTASYTGTDPSAAAGGGIANDGPMTVRHSRVTGNTVHVTRRSRDSFAFGAGHAAFAATTIVHSTISGNRASAPGGTARGALTSAVDMTVTDTFIRGNTASAWRGTVTGGGVAYTGTMLMTRTHVTGNRAIAEGGNALAGGIRIGPGGQLTLRDSAVIGNAVSAPHGRSAVGGGIDNSAGGTLTSSQSKIIKNVATALGPGTARGGGLFNAIGSASLTDSVVTGNTAGDGGGIFEESGAVTLSDSVVRGNRPNNCAPPNSVPGCVG